MNNGPDFWTHPEDIQRQRNQFYVIERFRDFLEWLFDTQVEWMSQEEAWELFEKHEDSLNNKLP